MGTQRKEPLVQAVAAPTVAVPITLSHNVTDTTSADRESGDSVRKDRNDGEHMSGFFTPELRPAGLGM
jgi:hypothetical protein